MTPDLTTRTVGDVEAWRERIEAKRAVFEHIRAVDTAAQYPIKPVKPARAAKPTKPRKTKAKPASTGRPVGRPSRGPALRPCAQCQHPTRPNRILAAAAPGTRPRRHLGLCSTCAPRPMSERTPRQPGAQTAPRAAGDRPHTGGRVLAVDLDRMLALYAAGATVRAVAETFGISNGAVRRRLAAAGVTTRDDRITNSGGRNKTDDQPETVTQMRDLAARELTRGEIATELGVTVGIVTGIMRRNAIVGRAQGPKVPIDGAKALKARMAAAGATSAGVRTWARTAGLTVPDTGLPSAATLDAYLDAPRETLGEFWARQGGAA